MRPHVSNLVFEWFHHKESSNIMLSKAWTLYSLKYTYFRTKKNLIFFYSNLIISFIHPKIYTIEALDSSSLWLISTFHNFVIN